MKKLGKVIIVMGLLSSLFGCKTTKGDNTTMPAKTNYKVVSYHYSYNNSFGDGSYSIDIEPNGEGYTLSYELWRSKYGIISTAIDSQIVDSLSEICKQSNIIEWDGFHKTNPDVLDGDGFGLRVKFEDGSVNASGSNRSPKGYRDFVNAVDELLNPIIEEMKEKARLSYIEEGFNGNINSLFVNIVDKSIPCNYEIFAHCYIDEEDNLARIDCRFNFKDDRYMPQGQYNCNKKVDNNEFDFNEIKQLLDKYSVYTNDGLIPTEKDGEWYQIEFGYDDEKYLFVMGSKPFENYDQFKSELLEIVFRLYDIAKD